MEISVKKPEDRVWIVSFNLTNLYTVLLLLMWTFRINFPEYIILDLINEDRKECLPENKKNSEKLCSCCKRVGVLLNWIQHGPVPGVFINIIWCICVTNPVNF